MQVDTILLREELHVHCVGYTHSLLLAFREHERARVLLAELK